MKPIEIARNMYKNFISDFDADLKWFKKYAWVIDNDKSFWLFRRHPERGNCWAIQMAVGDLGVWEQVMPFWLPYTSWARRGRGRGRMIFETDTVLKMIRAVRSMR